MKTKCAISFVLSLLILSSSLFAGMSSYLTDNDTIILKNGRRMLVMVKEVKGDKLTYRKTEYANLISLPLTEVSDIHYQDGRKYTASKPKVDTLASMEEQIRAKIKMETTQAKEDAHNNYAEGSVFIGSMLLTLLFGGILGLIPAGAFLSTMPTDEKMGLKSGKTEEYNTAYREEVRAIRRKSVWNGFGVGLLFAGVFGLILYLKGI